MNLERRLQKLHRRCAVSSGHPEHAYWHGKLLDCIRRLKGVRPLTAWEAWVIGEGPIPSGEKP